MNRPMNIKHHPSEALLVDYASGAMGQAQSLVIAAHVHACPACREQVAAAEAMGGALLESLPDAGLSTGALDRALARLEQPAPEPTPIARAPVPQPADWIKVPREVSEAARRKRWVAPGVWVAPIYADAKGRPEKGKPLSYLLRVGAGMRMPQHTHNGCELTLILKGAFADGDEVFRPGDVAETDDSIQHSPHITVDGECVCLVACDNPLIVNDTLGKIVQRYAGI